jgi:hypothetical protein
VGRISFGWKWLIINFIWILFTSAFFPGLQTMVWGSSGTHGSFLTITELNFYVPASCIMYLSYFCRFLLCTCGWERRGERRGERRVDRRGERGGEEGG